MIQFFNDRRGRALCGLGAAGAETTAAATQPALTGRERGAAVLVGTPGPAGASQHHECVLWSRLGIGLLSAAATRAALVEPLAGTACASTPTPLMRQSNTASANSYLAQLWGGALWKRRLACESARKVTPGRRAKAPSRLTPDHARAARPAVASLVADYYEDRYLELDQSGRL